MPRTEPCPVFPVRNHPRPTAASATKHPRRWSLGALALLAATLGRAHGQEALARLDPVGAGILPASGFGAAVGYVEALDAGAPRTDAPRCSTGAAVCDEVADGDLVLVGAPRDTSAGSGRGAVHVFLRRAGGFDRARHLLPPTDPNHAAVLSVAEQFGAALAVMPPPRGVASPDLGPAARSGAHGGALVAVGAPGRDVEHVGNVVPAAGGVSLFRRVPGAEGHWQLAAELLAPTPEGGSRFGASVALGRSSDLAHGDRLAVVGAPLAAAPGASLGGSATVFAEGPVGITGARVWTVQATLTAPRPTSAGAFGASVAVVEDARGITAGPMATCVAVAAPGDAAAGPGAGAVFLFDLHGHLLDLRRAADDVHHGQPHGARYGERIAGLGRGRLAIAVPARGVVEVVRIEGGTFVREALLAAHPLVGFGIGLAGAGGDLLAVGAPFEGVGAGAPSAPLLGAGRVHVFRRTGDVWCAAPRLGDAWPTSLPTSGAEPRDELGHALVFGRGGAALVVAAPASDAACPGGTACDAGAAFVFMTRPRTKSFCAEGARGALEVLGSARASDGRLRFVIGGVAPGSQGALHAAARATEPATPATGCLVQPLHRLGTAVSDAGGRWQLDAAAQLAGLERISPGTTWAFQVAWREGGHSSALTLALTR
jgi:hypothetical protein